MNMSQSEINVSLCLTDPIKVKNLNHSEITHQTHYHSSYNPDDNFLFFPVAELGELQISKVTNLADSLAALARSKLTQIMQQGVKATTVMLWLERKSTISRLSLKVNKWETLSNLCCSSDMNAWMGKNYKWTGTLQSDVCALESRDLRTMLSLGR